MIQSKSSRLDQKLSLLLTKVNKHLILPLQHKITNHGPPLIVKPSSATGFNKYKSCKKLSLVVGLVLIDTELPKYLNIKLL
jgi:hypothetical protein